MRGDKGIIDEMAARIRALEEVKGMYGPAFIIGKLTEIMCKLFDVEFNPLDEVSVTLDKLEYEIDVFVKKNGPLNAIVFLDSEVISGPGWSNFHGDEYLAKRPNEEKPETNNQKPETNNQKP